MQPRLAVSDRKRSGRFLYRFGPLLLPAVKQAQEAVDFNPLHRKGIWVAGKSVQGAVKDSPGILQPMRLDIKQSERIQERIQERACMCAVATAGWFPSVNGG